ncbi:MAG: methionine--tRNA ligase [Spirochaetales bacterium]|nr:methionine--tRNA ligase [Spirochaetales bacterium]
MSDKFYVTTAIAYPNGRPHMGHALEIIEADVIARFQRLLGREVVFQTGTDEHGSKNWEAAKKAGKPVIEFLNGNVAVFQDLYRKLSISTTHFIRTSDKAKHYPGVQTLWNKLAAAGDIYKQNYTGLYCVGCESFKTEKELIDGKCPVHPTREMQTIEEENYFFRLSKYKDKLIELISEDRYQVVPESRKNEILSFLKQAKDISFSRPKTSLPWGIPVPDDDEHVMYVWCDALSNYITGVGYGRDENEFNATWPCDVHVIGKDILRFHAAFWPAMLTSAGIEIPKKLFVHGFVTLFGKKMSKSEGVVIDPSEQLSKFGVDVFRFCLLSSMPIDGDGDYSEEAVIAKTNNELVANVTNFCYRTLSFLKKNCGGSFSQIDDNKELISQILTLAEKAGRNYQNFNFKESIKTALDIAGLGNKYFQDHEPWKIIKQDADKGTKILGTCINIAKIISIILTPVMPDFCRELQRQLGLADLGWKDINFDTSGHAINDAKIIINRINAEEFNKKLLFPLNLRVAKITDIKQHPDADKLYIETIDYGDSSSQIVSGLVPYYKPEELLGKHVVIVTNLKKAKLRGVESHGMLLAAGDEQTVIVLEAPNSAPGSRIELEGYEIGSARITIDDFAKTKLTVKNKTVEYQGVVLKTGSENIFVDAPDGFRIS